MGGVRLGGSIFGRRRSRRRVFLTFKVVSMPAKAGIMTIPRSPKFFSPLWRLITFDWEEI